MLAGKDLHLVTVQELAACGGASHQANVSVQLHGTLLTLLDLSLEALNTMNETKTAPPTLYQASARDDLPNGRGRDVFHLQNKSGHPNLKSSREHVNLLPEDLRAAHVRVPPADQMPAQRAGGQR